ncbi:hypothetical protein EVAR_100196_1 [Eumeta japonica]|uniref:Uncharacterized protein n=1 Tax=Eumeta variegata TaxID=151549 RepID=A0A4C2AC24_EUMVA|nr:hypothetical protein EVAR_100196_1 [Eumeta japonica]
MVSRRIGDIRQKTDSESSHSNACHILKDNTRPAMISTVNSCVRSRQSDRRDNTGRGVRDRPQRTNSRGRAAAESREGCVCE